MLGVGVTLRMLTVQGTLLAWCALLSAFLFALCGADNAQAPVNQQTGLSGCGDLAGTCNSLVCCCNSGGFVTQVPTEEGTCKTEPSTAVGGTIFLVIAGLVPAFASFVLFRLTNPLRLKSGSQMLSKSGIHSKLAMNI
jgi:hypothetical protein